MINPKYRANNRSGKRKMYKEFIKAAKKLDEIDVSFLNEMFDGEMDYEEAYRAHLHLFNQTVSYLERKTPHFEIDKHYFEKLYKPQKNIETWSPKLNQKLRTLFHLR